jgi:hypothetical protein
LPTRKGRRRPGSVISQSAVFVSYSRKSLSRGSLLQGVAMASPKQQRRFAAPSSSDTDATAPSPSGAFRLLGSERPLARASLFSPGGRIAPHHRPLLRRGLSFCAARAPVASLRPKRKSCAENRLRRKQLRIDTRFVTTQLHCVASWVGAVTQGRLSCDTYSDFYVSARSA